MTSEEANKVYEALVVVSLALTDHGHYWTKDQRNLFSAARRILKASGAEV